MGELASLILIQHHLQHPQSSEHFPAKTNAYVTFLTLTHPGQAVLQGLLKQSSMKHFVPTLLTRACTAAWIAFLHSREKLGNERGCQPVLPHCLTRNAGVLNPA